MLRTKDEQLNYDVRYVKLLKRLGKQLPEGYDKHLKALTDSEKIAEYTAPFIDEEEKKEKK